MKQLLEVNAAKVRDLHAAIDSTFAHRSKGPEEWKAWKEACELFHKSYDALAFPGGLTHGFELLKAGDLATAEAAITFCEIRPYFFRSQYNRTSLLRLLRKIDLTPHLAERLLAVREEDHRRKMCSRARYLEQWRERARALREKLKKSGA